LDAYKNNFRRAPQRCKETLKSCIYSLLQKYDNTSLLLLLKILKDSSRSPEIHQKGTGLKCCKSVKGPGKREEQYLKDISSHGKVELVGEFNGMKAETTYRRLIHDQVWLALSGNIQ